MALASMDLLKHPAHSRFAPLHEHEDVLAYKSILCILVNDFDVGESLLIGASRLRGCRRGKVPDSLWLTSLQYGRGSPTRPGRHPKA